jgi:hypothetical protein
MALRTTPPTISREEWQEAANEAVRRQNEFYRTARISEQTESDETVSALNSAPEEEFQSLVNEDAQTEETDQNVPTEPDGYDNTASENSGIGRNLAAEQALNRGQQQKIKQNDAQKNAVVSTLENQLVEEKSNLDKIRREEQELTVLKQIAKLIATSGTIVTIPYYLAKIILSSIFSREGSKTRDAKRKIKETETKLRSLQQS